jgi:glycosyltransferase involved in cell wall biosynthesis
MKIVYLTTESYYKEPIIKSQVEPLILNLIDKGLNIELLTFETLERKKFNENGYIHHQLQFRSHFINMFILIFYGIRLINKKDIIHVRSYPPMIAALFIKFLKGNKVVFDPRGLWPEEISYNQSRYILSEIFSFFERIFVKYSNFIVFVSTPFQELFLRRYRIERKKTIVIPTYSVPFNSNNLILNSVKDLRKDIFRLSDCIIFVYSGSIAEYQMIDEVIDFFQLASDLIPNSRFLILSKSADKFKAKLEGRLKDYSYFICSAEYNEIGYYLTQCNYGILFRESHVINQVADPIKAKDYLFSKLKIIATNSIGDIDKIITNYEVGYVLNDLSRSSMINSLNEIIKSDFEMMKRESYEKLLVRYSIHTVSKEYHNLYNLLQ